MNLLRHFYLMVLAFFGIVTSSGTAEAEGKENFAQNP
jgi:hypothetical protein